MNRARMTKWLMWLGVAVSWSGLVLLSDAQLAPPLLHTVTKVSMDTEQPFPRGVWYTVAWDSVEMDDVGAWNGSTTIVVPDPVSPVIRGQCALQIGLQLLPESFDDVWFAKITNNGIDEVDLPFLGEHLNTPAGLTKLTAYGPWFKIGPGDAIKPGDSLEVMVLVQGQGETPKIDPRSWFQCEWIVDF